MYTPIILTSRQTNSSHWSTVYRMRRHFVATTSFYAL